MHVATIRLPTNGVPTGTVITIELGDGGPDLHPAEREQRKLDDVRRQWFAGQIKNEQVIRLYGDQLLRQWQESERGAFRRRRLLNGGPRDDRRIGTPWHQAKYGMIADNEMPDPAGDLVDGESDKGCDGPACDAAPMPAGILQVEHTHLEEPDAVQNNGELQTVGSEDESPTELEEDRPTECS